jgi:hypothetical protein
MAGATGAGAVGAQVAEDVRGALDLGVAFLKQHLARPPAPPAATPHAD